MKRLTPLELIYAFDMALACAISYVLTTELLGAFTDRGDTLLGAVGVSGDTSDNDEACAVAGIEAAGLKGNAG